MLGPISRARQKTTSQVLMFSSEILALGGKLHSHKVLSYISLKLPRVWANLLWRGEATLGAKIFPSKQAVICALLASWGREKEYQSMKGSFSWNNHLSHTVSHTYCHPPHPNFHDLQQTYCGRGYEMSQPIMNGGYYFSPSGTPYTYQVGHRIFQHSKMSFPIWNSLQFWIS